MVVEACSALGSAIRNRVKYGKTEATLLRHASKQYQASRSFENNKEVEVQQKKYPQVCCQPEFLDQITQLGRLFVMVLPACLFFMGFYQQGSTWTIQATQMNGKFEWFTIFPDQMQFCKPMLTIILVPTSVKLIYPVLDKIGILKP